MEKSASILAGQSWKALGVGLITLIVTPIAAIILLVTVVGAPIGLLLIVMFAIALYFAKFIVMYWIGSLVAERFQTKQNPYATMIIGTIIFFIITLVPVVSFVVQLVTVLFGMGTLLLLKKTYYHDLRGKKLL